MCVCVCVRAVRILIRAGVVSLRTGSSRACIVVNMFVLRPSASFGVISCVSLLFFVAVAVADVVVDISGFFLIF